jgi:hypothetical protein
LTQYIRFRITILAKIERKTKPTATTDQPEQAQEAPEEEGVGGEGSEDITIESSTETEEEVADA